MGDKLNKKILFLASWYPSKENPSLGNFVEKHAEAANKAADIDVLYAVSSNSINECVVQDELVNQVRTVIVYYPKVKSKLPLLKSFLKIRAYRKALVLGFQKLNTTYDLVHLNAVFPAGIFAQWLKNKYDIPYILTVHWTGFLPQNPLFLQLPFYLRTKYKSTLSNANKVYTVSNHLGESLIQLGLIQEYEVISNVVSKDLFYPADIKRESSSPIRFIHISTFDDNHKNISGMLSAIGKLKRDFRLHLITEGSEEDVWKAIHRFTIPPEKCIVESKRSPREVADAMRLADCMVLFSNYETFSVVLAEAWSTGIPVIYTKCGGLTEINNFDLGIQLSIGDEKGLLEALTKFENKKYSQLKISEFAQQFTSDSLTEFFQGIYS